MNIQLIQKKELLFLLVFFFSILTNAVYAEREVVWQKDTKHISLGKSISILEDKTLSLKLSDVLSERIANQFIPSDRDVPGYGVTESAFWVRFKIQNSETTPHDLILEIDQAQFDIVEFYIEDPITKEFSSQVTGDQYPFSSRAVEHFNFLFPIHIPAESERQVYLRLVMNGPTMIPLHLWEPKSFFSNTALSIYGFGAFIGIMSVMLFYNLFLFVSVKDISYLYYLLLTGSMLIVTLTFTGLDTQFLWQKSPTFGEYIHHWAIMSGNIFANLFVMQFLNTKTNMPRTHKFLQLVISLCVIVIFFPFFLPITAVIKTNIPLFLINIALTVSNVLSDNFFTRYSMQFASVLQVTLFSFALADRINILKREREKALLEKLAESEKVASLSRAFERFVPKQFLEYLEKENITSIQLGDNIQKNMTILFCDIRSFTDMSEAMSPNDNFTFINEYLSRVGPLIRNHGGFIDKYIGDAIMALFPDTIEAAIDSAISIQKEVKAFNEVRKEKRQHLINIGIGIHTGNLMLGTVGEESRMDTTVISDAVNLASRIEGRTKELNAPIVVSETAFSKVKNPEIYPYRSLGKFKVKGKKEEVGLIEIIESSLDHFTPEKLQTKKEFESAISLFESQNYIKAATSFTKVLKDFPQDAASKLYILRCEKQMGAAIR